MPVVIKGPFRQVCIGLGSGDPLADPFLVGVPSPRHPKAIGLHKVDPKRMARLTRHAHRLGPIGTKAHLVEQQCQCVKIPLEA